MSTEGKGVESEGGDDKDERRRQRLAQLAVMSREEFLAEVAQHRAAKWGVSGLSQHYAQHGDQIADVLGWPVSEQAYADLSLEIQQQPDRVFTGTDDDSGDINYVFIRLLPGRRVMIQVIVRRGLIRSMYPMSLARWLRRYREMVEVTGRV